MKLRGVVGRGQAEKAAFALIVGFTGTLLAMALAGVIIEPAEETDLGLGKATADRPISRRVQTFESTGSPRQANAARPGRLPTAPAGSVKGRVLLPDGSACAGAVIEVRPMNASPEAAAVEQQSGEQGEFLLTGVPAGQPMVLSARRRGYLAAQAGGFTVDRETAFDAGVLRLGEMLSIILTVSNARQQPLPGARVRLTALDPAGGEIAGLEERTDLHGEAVFVAIESPRVRLAVEADGYACHEVTFTAAPSREGAPLRWSITLRRGEGHLAGRVSDSLGQPVAGVILLAAGLDNENRMRILYEATSASDGSFRLGGLPDLPFEIDTNDPAHYLEQPVPAHTGDESVELVVQPTGWLSGLLKVSGPLPPEATVRVFELDTLGNTRPTAQRVSVTPWRSASPFEMRGLRAGRYIVGVSCEGYPPAHSAPFKILPGACTTGVTVTMKAGCDVSGRIEGPGAQPLAGAHVLLERARRPPGARIAGILVRTPRTSWKAVTDEHGGFVFRGVGAETYRLTATWGGFAPLQATGIKIEPPDANDIGVFTLSRGGSISGRVLGTDGRAIGQMRLIVKGAGREPKLVLRTTPDGTFRTTALAPGRYTVALAPAGTAMSDSIGTAREVLVKNRREATVELIWRGR